jgi:arginase family enzyme
LIKPDQLRFVGNLLLEKEEERFINNNRIKVYSSQEATENNAFELLKWAQNRKHLHISFDVDVFNDKIMSATGTRNPKKLHCLNRFYA